MFFANQHNTLVVGVQRESSEPEGRGESAWGSLFRLRDTMPSQELSKPPAGRAGSIHQQSQELHDVQVRFQGVDGTLEVRFSTMRLI